VPRSIEQVPNRGLELRVSLGAGFRVQKPGVRDLSVPPGVTRLAEPKPLSASRLSQIRREASFLVVEPMFPKRPAPLPAATLPVPTVHMTWPGATLAPPKRRGIDSNHIDVRTDWTSSQDRSLALFARSQVQPVGLPQKPAMKIFALATPPVPGLADPHTATVSFTPAEPVFGYSNEDLEKR
jgi:hypothetical protein